eukprot:PhF_6_TR12629/c3_g1_i2/m.19999
MRKISFSCLPRSTSFSSNQDTPLLYQRQNSMTRSASMSLSPQTPLSTTSAGMARTVMRLRSMSRVLGLAKSARNTMKPVEIISLLPTEIEKCRKVYESFELPTQNQVEGVRTLLHMLNITVTPTTDELERMIRRSGYDAAENPRLQFPVFLRVVELLKRQHNSQLKAPRDDCSLAFSQFKEGEYDATVDVDTLQTVLQDVGIEFDFQKFCEAASDGFDGAVGMDLFRLCCDESSDMITMYVELGGGDDLSGSISSEAFITRCVHLGLPRGDVEHLVACTDVDGNGTLEFFEFVALMNRLRTGKVEGSSEANNVDAEATESNPHSNSNNDQQQPFATTEPVSPLSDDGSFTLSPTQRDHALAMDVPLGASMSLGLAKSFFSVLASDLLESQRREEVVETPIDALRRKLSEVERNIAMTQKTTWRNKLDGILGPPIADEDLIFDATLFESPSMSPLEMIPSCTPRPLDEAIPKVPAKPHRPPGPPQLRCNARIVARNQLRDNSVDFEQQDATAAAIAAVTAIMSSVVYGFGSLRNEMTIKDRIRQRLMLEAPLRLAPILHNHEPSSVAHHPDDDETHTGVRPMSPVKSVRGGYPGGTMGHDHVKQPLSKPSCYGDDDGDSEIGYKVSVRKKAPSSRQLQFQRVYGSNNSNNNKLKGKMVPPPVAKQRKCKATRLPAPVDPDESPDSELENIPLHVKKKLN